jgi:TPR repeat protein
MDYENTDAFIHLSYMYKTGLGFDRDEEMAKKLLEQAAQCRNSTALYMLKEMGGSFD